MPQPSKKLDPGDRALIKSLLAGAMHSRAAYGYAMQAGHLTSVLNYALLHTVHAFRCFPKLVKYPDCAISPRG